MEQALQVGGVDRSTDVKLEISALKGGTEGVPRLRAYNTRTWVSCAGFPSLVFLSFFLRNN